MASADSAVPAVSFSLRALENADLSQPPEFEGSRFQFLVGGDVSAAVRKQTKKSGKKKIAA